MRETYNNIPVQETKDKIVIDNIPDYDTSDYDLNKPKDEMRFLFSIERICRNSRAYKKLINFLREFIDMNKCSFYKNINNIDTYAIKIHIHHSPLTLFDIVQTVYRKRKATGQPITENLIAKEVMYNHYKMHIGLIPLSETVHELVHSGSLFIPTNVVYGYYKQFIEDYKPYIDQDLLSNLMLAEKATEEYDYEKQTKVLEFKMVYIDPSGAYEFPSFSDISKMLQNKLEKGDDSKDDIYKSNTQQNITTN